jgi:type IV pilus assembly protein PilV
MFRGVINRNAQLGFTLIEAMVALLVLAIGMLGVSGLQMVGMRNNNNAYLRSQVTSQIYNIMDRMRANMDAVIDGNYRFNRDSAEGVPSITHKCLGSQVPSSGITECTPDELAAEDLADWTSGLATRFPSGWAVNLTCADADAGDGDPCTTGSIHTVQVTITERGDPNQAGGQTQNLVVNMSLRP